jgi:hypothetical protein
VKLLGRVVLAIFVLAAAFIAVAYMPPWSSVGKASIYISALCARRSADPSGFERPRRRDAVTDAMTGHVLAYGEIAGLFGG